MTQSVRKALEYMVDELQYYRKNRIFKAKEIDRIVQKRKEFEEALQTKRSAEVYLKYIEYEVVLEKIFTKRASNKKNIREYCTKRIQRLFEQAGGFFPTEHAFPISHLDYLLYRNDRDGACKLALNIPKKHPSVPEVWTRCAKALRECGETEASRSLLERGMRLVEPMKIIPEYIKMEEASPDKNSEQIVAILNREVARENEKAKERVSE